MTGAPAYVIFTSGINDDPHDSDVGEVIGTCKDGMVKILFANGDDYRAFPEELVVVP